MKWILNHLKICLAILVFGITAIVVGVVMINSFTSYKKYEKTYYANDLEVRSVNPAAPKYTEVNDAYKSQYKYTYSAQANAEGDTNLALYLDAKSFADIEIVVNAKYTEDLLANMQVKVNDSLVEDSAVTFGTKPAEGQEAAAEEHNLVLANFALPEGDFTINVGNFKNDTTIKSIKVFTSAKVTVAA